MKYTIVFLLGICVSWFFHHGRGVEAADIPEPYIIEYRIHWAEADDIGVKRLTTEMVEERL